MRWFILSFCLLFTGCANMLDNYPVFKPKKDWENEKLKIQQEYAAKTDATIKDIELKQRDKDLNMQANLQKASGLAYGILQLSEIKPNQERTRPDNLINFKSKELVTRLPDLPGEEILKINDELRKELDEKNTTLQQLQKNYSQALEQSQKDKLALKQINEEIELKKQELQSIEKQKTSAELQLADQRQKADAAEKAKLAELAKNEESKKELIKYLIKIFVGVGVLCAVGAYAMRSLMLAGAAALAFGLSVSIAFIETWMIILAGCLILITIVAGIGYKLYQTHKNEINEKELSDRLVGSIQNFKEKIGSDEFKTKLGVHIEDWIKDKPELRSTIDKKLKDLNLT